MQLRGGDIKTQMRGFGEFPADLEIDVIVCRRFRTSDDDLGELEAGWLDVNWTERESRDNSQEGWFFLGEERKWMLTGDEGLEEMVVVRVVMIMKMLVVVVMIMMMINVDYDDDEC